MILSSSADSLCPGEGVVFTCVTDTGRLVWDIKDTAVSFHSPALLNYIISLDTVFNVTLLNITGNIYHSTATAVHVPINYNGTTVECRGQTIANKQQRSIIIGMYVCVLKLECCNPQLSAEPPASPPLNLTSSSTLSSVTISWVAPLDTPLCVHSYTVTVRNSSQVMVYNTTDYRSSLSITDLTSDGEYSVTVAGRDGAGQLGQESEELELTIFESEELTISKSLKFQVVVGYRNQQNSVIVQWKVSK